MTDVPIAVGVVRPARPAGPIAEAEARVIRAELARRLGPVTCDLRVDGPPVGPWSSRATAAWPADIDVEIDPAGLWNDDLPPLSALFGRTVDPTAADVRRRMLEHLGIGGSPVADEMLDHEVPWRPTDLWLLVRHDGVAEGASPDLVALADGPAMASALDAAFDEVATEIRGRLTDDRAAAEAVRLRARVTELERQLADARSDADRRAAEAARVIDELRSENSVLLEREQRASVDRDLAADQLTG